MSGEIFTVRASSLGTLFDCSMRWEGEHLIRLRRATSLRAWLGTSIHASTAAFDQATLAGESISANEAADVFVSTLWDPTEEVDFKDPKLSMKQAEVIGLTLHARYCSEIAPLMNFESVEMQLKPLDIEAEGVIIRMTGTMDRARVARASGKKVIADLKTGGRLIDTEGVVSIKGRAAQLGTYQLLSEYTDGEQTAGAQIMALQTTTASKIGVSRVFDAKSQLVGTEHQPGLLDMAAKMFKIGLYAPNPASSLCDKKWCSSWDRCKFHD